MEYIFLEIWRFEKHIRLSEKKPPLDLTQTYMEYDMGKNILGNSQHASVVSGQSKGSALKKNERGHESTKHLIVQASTQSFLDKVLQWTLLMKYNLQCC